METTASHFPGYFTKDSGNDALTGVSANASIDNAYRIAKAEADIKEALGNGFCEVEKSIGDASCENIKSQGEISHRNTIHLNSVERDLQNRILENRAIITKEIGDKTDRLRDQSYSFERSISEKLCEIKAEAKDNTRLILDRLTSDKLDEKQEIIDSLRHERSHDRHNHAFAMQNMEIASLKQMLNSVEQSQRFSSKTVQFGAGNVAIPTQTANQG